MSDTEDAEKVAQIVLDRSRLALEAYGSHVFLLLDDIRKSGVLVSETRLMTLFQASVAGRIRASFLATMEKNMGRNRAASALATFDTDARAMFDESINDYRSGVEGTRLFWVYPDKGHQS